MVNILQRHGKMLWWVSSGDRPHKAQEFMGGTAVISRIKGSSEQRTALANQDVSGF